MKSKFKTYFGITGNLIDFQNNLHKKVILHAAPISLLQPIKLFDHK
jgi:hypothetical protein